MNKRGLCIIFVLVVSMGIASSSEAAYSWQLLDGELNIPRHALTSEAINGYVYAIGGIAPPHNVPDSQNAVSRYDPATDSWSLVDSMPTARHSLGSAVIDGWIYAVGGHVVNSRSENQRYNGTSWESRASVYARSSPGVAAYNGELYVFGGNHYGTGLSRFDIYNPTTNTWRIGGNIPVAGTCHRALTFDDKIYVLNYPYYEPGSGRELWAYDPIADTWDTSIPLMNVSRQTCELQAVNGRIYVIGGSGSSGAIASVESWTPGEASWQMEPSLNVARSNFGSAVIGNDIYVFGGFNGNGDLGSTEVLTICETVIEVAIDIKPGSCPNPLRVNFRGQGVFPVAIVGGDPDEGGFDVFSVDVATITLHGVSPIRSNYDADVSTPSEGEGCECNSEGPDGIFDLTLKFDRQAILAALEVTHGDLTELPNRAELPLTLDAMLLDGTLIEGTDCLTILNRGAIRRSRR